MASDWSPSAWEEATTTTASRCGTWRPPPSCSRSSWTGSGAARRSCRTERRSSSRRAGSSGSARRPTEGSWTRSRRPGFGATSSRSMRRAGCWRSDRSRIARCRSGTSTRGHSSGGSRWRTSEPSTGVPTVPGSPSPAPTRTRSGSSTCRRDRSRSSCAGTRAARGTSGSSAAGERLASVGQNGELRVWDVTPDGPPALRAVTPRSGTPWDVRPLTGRLGAAGRHQRAGDRAPLGREQRAAR